ncbi:Protein of unknown function [Methanobrevibacter gottschalkii]|uniref:DUF3021 domain-containing protein n=1 Tax=Methanobrevibacter gottschalkii TaxID=190974 RepID=A0A1H7HF49_9EURY|nr:DUF3021 domain-containing protein [Methanobrevibacter gottschalkii]MCQ2971182.1 DUF3021 domain-containing protein [archaeon]SEK48939.1 Protein of unknown function [Methanobrevibacter gottschalkii]
MKVKLIEKFALGAFVGCFIVMCVMVLISLYQGPQNIRFSGIDIINSFFGSIVAGWGFTFSGFIYDKDDLPLPFQVIIQMGVGMTILLLIAIYLKWMPINLGIGPIVTWIAIACIFAIIFWLGFYIYYYLVARDLNNRLHE